MFHAIYFWLSYQKQKFALPRIDHLNAVSPGIADKLLKIFNLHATVTPNGYSPTREKKAVQYTRESLGLNKTDKVLLFVGMSSWTKGFVYFAELMRQSPEYKAIVVGIHLKKVPQNIINLPYVPHVIMPQLYMCADVFVHTAVTEAFGLVYPEAMHHGVPVVSFKTDGADLLIQSGKNGFIVPARDVGQLRQCVHAVLSNVQLRRSMIAAAKQTVKQFTFKRTAYQNLLEYYKTLNQQTVLCIPHVIRNGVRSRTEEIARALVLRDNKVFMLGWGARADRQYGLSLSNIVYALRELLRRPKIVCRDGIRYMYLPRLVFPVGLATLFNSYILNRFIKKAGIQKVINAAFLYYKIDNEKLDYVYDLVDDHVAYTAHNGRLGAVRLAKRMETYIDGEIEKAKRVVYVSMPLRDRYGSRGKSKVIPNGAFMDQYVFDQVTLKQKYNLTGKYVYGLIGNHGEWSGIAEMISFFKQQGAALGKAILVIAGPVYDKKLVRRLPKNIVYLGTIPKAQINEIYGLIDCGIQAADDDEFRRMTAPLKVIEYSAARKIVWALQAENLNAYALPNLVISARDTASMLKTLKKCQTLSWKNNWDLILRHYDWRQLVTKF